MNSSNPRADKLLLMFDGYNIVRRVYGAIPGDDSPEKVEGVLKSSLGSFYRALKDYSPTHVLAAFDFGGKTFRHEMYPQYKALRKPMPEVLKVAMPGFIEKLREVGIPTVCIEGVEAEDVIATAAKRWLDAGKGRAIAMSTDKDVAQMTPAGLQVIDQFQKKALDEAWCQNKFGVPITLLGDCLSLMSDTVDGIPGVPKVGPKTAAAWLLKYGDLAGVLANKDALTGVVGANLRAHYDDVVISRKLVELKTDVAINVTWNQLIFSGTPWKKVLDESEIFKQSE